MDKKRGPGESEKKAQKTFGVIFEPSLSLCLVSPSAVMIKRGLFETAGLFDERLPACEDYDLWLRISCRYPVFLLDTPLIMKRGGHEDQLSRMWGLDKFRIQSVRKVIESGLLSSEQQRAAIKMLKEKCRIYAGGCMKRGRENEALYYMKLEENYRDFT